MEFQLIAYTFTLKKAYHYNDTSKNGCMKKTTIGLQLKQLREDLEKANIPYTELVYHSRDRQHNDGKGWSLDQVKNMMSGRSPIQPMFLKLCLDLISADVEKLRALANEDPMPLFDKLEGLRTERQQIEQSLLQTQAA